MKSALLALLLASGCVYAYVEPLNGNRDTRAARPTETVEVFLTKRPTREYTEVAMIEARDTGFADRDDVLAELRAEAGRQGCDALILAGGGTQIDNNGVTEIERGVCIVYDAPDPAGTALGQAAR